MLPLVLGKSTGDPWKTTPCQDRALFRMVRQDRFISAQAFAAQMRNLYDMRAGQKTTSNWLLSDGYHAYMGTEVAESDNGRLAASHLPWRVQISDTSQIPHQWALQGHLRNTLVPFARQHFENNYHYPDDKATPHHAQVLLDFLQ